MNLGTFGKDTPTVDVERKFEPADVFTFCGVEIRTRQHTDVPVLPMMEFASIITVPTPEKSYVAQGTIYGLLYACILPDDWQRFRALADGVDSVDPNELVQLAFALYGAWAQHPFPKARDSSDGFEAKATDPSHGVSSQPSSPDSPPPVSSSPNGQLALAAEVSTT